MKCCGSCKYVKGVHPDVIYWNTPFNALSAAEQESCTTIFCDFSKGKAFPYWMNHGQFIVGRGEQWGRRCNAWEPSK